MKAHVALHLVGEAKRLAREESGVALMLTLAVFLLLFILCCGVYATGEIIRQRIELQNACDAAAYSASVVQADALSRMAVVNRAMAWTYIQMSREQMDYIVFSWLDLTTVRFWYDWKHKAQKGDIFAMRHFDFEGWTLGFCGLHDFFCRHDDAYYAGVGSTLEQRHQKHVSLNWRNWFDASVAVDDIDDVLNEISGRDRAGWKKDMEDAIRDLKDAIGDMNDSLWAINRSLQISIPATVEFVLKENLPQDELGALADDFFWMTAGGTSDGPAAYGGGGTNGYFDALYNTEEDEIQFLQMADGLPSRQTLAPFWMKSRPVVLSDYFGGLGNPTQFGLEGLRYEAGGLDQWYSRGTEEEATSSGEQVEKIFFHPPGNTSTNMPTPGIQRVYKHTNREEGMVFGHFLRPNHVFQFGLNSLPAFVDTGIFDFLVDPGRFLRRVFKEAADEIRDINPWSDSCQSWGDLVESAGRSFSSGLMAMLRVKFTQALGGSSRAEWNNWLNQLMGTVMNGDIPPSNEHALARYPDQCENVATATALVAQYEWASAYWICPWIITPWTGLKELGHWRLPISEIRGCEEHGYGEMLSWLVKQIQILAKGKVPRDEYESCFINFDPTTDIDKNTILRGYARVYGDDKDIFNVTGYVGAVSRPWVLKESFFSGDGTILVGLARVQENPFKRLLARGVVRPSIYEPFSPQGDGGKYLVALAAARAVWAPRPDRPGTGMETMNNGRAPGQYEPRFDAVTDNKFKIPDNEYASLRMGCVCGEEDTQGRLLRMWNLSQTDWDGALLPLRHAFAGHSHYDSHANLKDGSEWEFEDADRNAVIRLVDILFRQIWHGLRNKMDWRTSYEVMAIPDATGVDPSILDRLEVLMPISVRVKEMFIFRRLL